MDRVQPIPSLTLRQPSASPSGLPLWWEVAAHEQRDAGEQAEPTSIPAAAAAEKAAALLRVIVNVRINGREPKARTAPSCLFDTPHSCREGAGHAMFHAKRFCRKAAGAAAHAHRAHASAMS